MGAVLSIPLALTPVATCCTAACVSMFTSTAASAMCSSCNCQSSIATRTGYALLFCLDALVAWLSLTPVLARTVEEWTFHYIQMQCSQNDACFGVMAVHRITFALALFHVVLALLLHGVHDSRSPRAALQNGWWGPKLVAWVALVLGTFLVPNPFFVFWANYVAPFFAVAFLLLGLVLLVDFAHTWSEACLERWERFESDVWKFVLVGSTLGLYVLVLVATLLLYVVFATHGCRTNQVLITVNLLLGIVLTVMCVHPRVQEANPRSGLAQSSMVLAYCTYLLSSALMNHDNKQCNPIARGRGETTKATTALIGAIFTFLAIAYSTTRAATHIRMLSGSASGEITLEDEPVALHGPITTQPEGRGELRIAAIRSAVEAGSLPASILEEEVRAQQEQAAAASPRADDDERNGTRYNYTHFHRIFAMAACYLAMLLTDWQSVDVRAPAAAPDERVVYIGASSASMWIRVFSSWVCAALYGWTLVAPVLCMSTCLAATDAVPDRFV